MARTPLQNSYKSLALWTETLLRVKEQRGCTNKDIAQALGIGTTRLANINSGNRAPTMPEFLTLLSLVDTGRKVSTVRIKELVDAQNDTAV